MKKKVNLYLVIAVVPSGIFGVQESVSLVLGYDEHGAKREFCSRLPQKILRHLSKNPEHIKVNQIPDEQLAYWCKQVLGVRA